MFRLCKKCDVEKDSVDGFHVGTNICKECKKKYNKEYYAKKKTKKDVKEKVEEIKEVEKVHIKQEISDLTTRLNQMELIQNLQLEVQRLSARVTALEQKQMKSESLLDQHRESFEQSDKDYKK